MLIALVSRICSFAQDGEGLGLQEQIIRVSHHEELKAATETEKTQKCRLFLLQRDESVPIKRPDASAKSEWTVFPVPGGNK
jgi:hypothetical protein